MRKRAVIGLAFLLACGANFFASAFGATPADLDKQEKAAAQELELAYFELRLAEHVHLREQLELTTLFERGYSYEINEARGRVRRYGRIVAAKRARLEDVVRRLGRTTSPWVRTLLGNIETRLRLERPILNRGLASVDSRIERKSQLFLASFLPEPHMVVLRWESTRDLVGAATANAFIRATFGFREFTAVAPVTPPAARPNPAEIVLIGGEAQERAAFVAFAETRGFSVRLFQATTFNDPREQAQELMNFLSVGAETVSLVSFGEGAAVVRSLLDQFAILRRDGRVRAWVSVNGDRYGPAFLGAGARAPASAATRLALSPTDPKARNSMVSTLLRLRARTDILLSLGSGFPIVNLVDSELANDPAFPLFRAVELDGQNYFFAGEKGMSAVVGAVEYALTQPAR